MTGPRPVLELAELGVLRTINEGLRTRLADATAIADRRALEAHQRGLDRGRAGVVVALLLGGVFGSAATLIFFYFFASLA